MLVDGACSIYDDRPRTCRTYDCRIFPAAGVEVVDEHQVAIGRRSRRWQFDLATDADRIQHDAVRAAATWVGEHGDLLPEGVAPSNATQHAVLAIGLHQAFLHP
jgi:hypothetical protein